MAEHEFVKVAEVGDVALGQMTMVRLNQEQILLANIGGTFYAINNMCSHMKGRLAKGRLDDAEVICPFHSARFSVITGEALTSPATKSVLTYEVNISGMDILIKPVII